MKKKIISLVLAFLVIGGSCYAWGNYDNWDTVWTFTKAWVNDFEKGRIEVKVKQWRDFEESDMLQVTAEDGTVYLTHSTNVVLIAE